MMVITIVILGVTLGLTNSLMAQNKFEKEVEKEAGAVKLAREVMRGGYGLVTTSELKR